MTGGPLVPGIARAPRASISQRPTTAAGQVVAYDATIGTGPQTPVCRPGADALSV